MYCYHLCAAVQIFCRPIFFRKDCHFKRASASLNDSQNKKFLIFLINLLTVDVLSSFLYCCVTKMCQNIFINSINHRQLKQTAMLLYV